MSAPFAWLVSPAGQQALAEAEALEPQEADFLRCYTGLARRYPPEQARLALETAILRRAARVKFPAAGRMYFTRPALEQASSQAVAGYRALRYAGLAAGQDGAPGLQAVLDLGCSIGGDTLALAQHLPVTGVDLDPLRLQMARQNMLAAGPAAGHPAGFIQADLSARLPLRLSPEVGLFFDPARRDEQRRIYSVRQYHPPLAVIDGWLEQAPALGVKLSPGVDLDELSGYAAEIEFISLHGELKEAVLWFGPLRSAARRRATLLPGPHTLAGPGDDAQPPKTGGPHQTGGPPLGGEPPTSPPLAWLYEPDPAVLRAGLVRQLAAELGASQLDPDIAYLTGEHPVDTPFARRWAVDAWMPFQLKRLRAALRERRAGRLTVKKRGSPIEPQELLQSLRLKPAEHPEQRVLFLTHLRGEPVVVICYPAQ
ncbi:MAG: class I SAM-dependent methyltransferase [Chloroflexota bacterium]